MKKHICIICIIALLLTSIPVSVRAESVINQFASTGNTPPIFEQVSSIQDIEPISLEDRPCVTIDEDLLKEYVYIPKAEHHKAASVARRASDVFSMQADKETTSDKQSMITERAEAIQEIRALVSEGYKIETVFSAYGVSKATQQDIRTFLVCNTNKASAIRDSVLEMLPQEYENLRLIAADLGIDADNLIVYSETNCLGSFTVDLQTRNAYLHIAELLGENTSRSGVNEISIAEEYGAPSCIRLYEIRKSEFEYWSSYL